MRGARYLGKNICLLTISQFGTKILSFLLVPLYTSILTTAEYGTYDLFNTTITLLIPILTVNIADSVLRFSLDADKDKQAVFSISFGHFLVSVVFVLICLLINHFFNFSPVVDYYALYIFVMYCVAAFNGIITNFARGLDMIKDIAISGVLCSAVLIGLNILFFVPMRMRLNGYFLAHILGTLTQSVYLLLRVKLWKYIKVVKKGTALHKEMLDFCRPLIANNIAWWVNNVSDRYIVTWLCGVAVNGVYSVGYKIPTILNVFQSIFSQAWTLSAVRDFDPEDSDGFFSNMYSLYNFCMVLMCSGLIFVTRIMAYFLYAKDFFEAWKYVPFLLIAIVFGSLSGYIGGIFAAVKDSKIFAQTTVLSAVINIVLNIVLVTAIGPLGAAISTAVSYWVAWALRVYNVKKYIKMRINLVRDGMVYLILILQSCLLYIFQSECSLLYAIELILSGLIVLLYREQVIIVKNKIKKIVLKK